MSITFLNLKITFVLEFYFSHFLCRTIVVYFIILLHNKILSQSFVRLQELYINTGR